MSAVLTPRKQRSQPVQNPNRHETVQLSPRRILEAGTEFKVKGGNWFTFMYGWRDNEVTGFGPVGSYRARTRTFRLDAITGVRKQQRP